MIFDTLAAMADWLNDRKFDDNATPQDVRKVIDDLGRSTTSREVSDPVTKGGAMQFDGEDGKHESRVFASAMQTRTPRSEIEAAMGSSSSSSCSSSSSSSSSQNFAPAGLKLTVTGAAGTVTWGGRTWNLPADSGKSETLTLANSPNLSFNRGTRSDSLTISAYDRISYWDTEAGLFPGILLSRGWSVYSSSYISAINRVIFRDLKTTAIRTPPFSIFSQTVVADRKFWYASGVTTAPPWDTVSTLYSDLNMILGVSAASRNNYLMDDNFFGSYTNSGITYTWEKVV